MLTGDNELVTAKICREVGLTPDSVLLGADVERMNDAELAQAVETHNIFAKLTPSHKERIVRLLKANGHVVGFMGDGINDAAGTAHGRHRHLGRYRRWTSPRRRPTSSCWRRA